MKHQDNEVDLYVSNLDIELIQSVLVRQSPYLRNAQPIIIMLTTLQSHMSHSNNCGTLLKSTIRTRRMPVDRGDQQAHRREHGSAQ
jgi:hypothetical protein